MAENDPQTVVILGVSHHAIHDEAGLWNALSNDPLRNGRGHESEHGCHGRFGERVRRAGWQPPGWLAGDGYLEVGFHIVSFGRRRPCRESLGFPRFGGKRHKKEWRTCVERPRRLPGSVWLSSYWQADWLMLPSLNTPENRGRPLQGNSVQKRQ